MNQNNLCEDHGDAVRKYDAGYYKEKLEEGLIFQDVVTRELYQRGIVIVGFSSRRFQNTEGENMIGAEIKRDGNFRKTGNIYLETAEKSHPSNPNYVKSGILRDDNSWLFVIGDERCVYVFSTKYLRLLVAQKNWHEVKKTTSIGTLMPIDQAEKYCLRRIDMGRAK